MHSYFGIFVYLVLEQGSFELFFSISMILVNPIMSDGTDENWHHHGVVFHLIKILLLEEVEGEVIAFLNELNSLFMS
jgi:hypothetical protein